jgi:hypothetical protein
MHHRSQTTVWRRPAHAAIATAFGMALAAWAGAGLAAADRGAQQACRADAQALCAGVAPGGGRIAACLRSHESKLSPACKDQLATVETCAAELKKLCPDASGDRALRQCATTQQRQLSGTCRAALGA